MMKYFTLHLGRKRSTVLNIPTTICIGSRLSLEKGFDVFRNIQKYKIYRLFAKKIVYI